MTLTRTPIQIDGEKNIAIGIILDETFIKSIKPLLSDITLISSPYIRKVIEWGITYYSSHGEPVSATIKDLFEYKKKDMQDEDEVSAIEALLSHLNEKYVENGASFKFHFEFEKAEKYLKERSLTKLAERINGAVAAGNPEDAESEVAKYRRVEKSTGHGVDIFNDTDFAERIISAMQEPVFTIDGDLGKLLGTLHRGDVITVGAAMKKSKSFITQALTYYALTSNMSIAYFTIEMDDELMGGRLYQDFLGARAGTSKKDIRIPYFNKEGSIIYKTIPHNELSTESILKMQQKLKMQYSSKFRLYDMTSGGGTISAIESTLEQDAEFDNFYPDVVVIDYLGILKRDKEESREKFERESDRVQWFHQLAQKRKFLGISPFQYGRGASNGDSDHNNIAGNIHALDHITHALTVNQTPEEKAAQLFRLKFMGRYDGRDEELLCTNCLDIGRGIVAHKFLKDVTNYDDVLTAGADMWEKEESELIKNNN